MQVGSEGAPLSLGSSRLVSQQSQALTNRIQVSSYISRYEKFLILFAKVIVPFYVTEVVGNSSNKLSLDGDIHKGDGSPSTPCPIIHPPRYNRHIPNPPEYSPIACQFILVN